jgi:hypothetical protein
MIAQNGANKTTQEIDDKRLDSNTVYLLSGISPNNWWACSGTYRGRTS